ncbi:MAG: hypothetical protein ACLUFK_06165 [Oscillospiraceae bacterium]
MVSVPLPEKLMVLKSPLVLLLSIFPPEITAPSFIVRLALPATATTPFGIKYLILRYSPPVIVPGPTMVTEPELISSKSTPREFEFDVSLLKEYPLSRMIRSPLITAEDVRVTFPVILMTPFSSSAKNSVPDISLLSARAKVGIIAAMINITKRTGKNLFFIDSLLTT